MCSLSRFRPQPIAPKPRASSPTPIAPEPSKSPDSQNPIPHGPKAPKAQTTLSHRQPKQYLPEDGRTGLRIDGAGHLDSVAGSRTGTCQVFWEFLSSIGCFVRRRPKRALKKPRVTKSRIEVQSTGGRAAGLATTFCEGCLCVNR